MKSPLSISINLDEMSTGDEWGTKVGEIIRDTIEWEIKSMVKAAVKAELKSRQKEIENKIKQASSKLSRMDLAQMFAKIGANE